MSIKTSGKNATALQNKYISEAYDRINLTVPKGKKEIIKAAAESVGMSTNQFINIAIEDKIKKVHNENE